MTITPILPPLPPPEIVELGGKTTGYYATTTQKLREAAYQAGRDAGLAESTKAFEIADAAMFDLLVAHGIPDEDLLDGQDSGIIYLVGDGQQEVKTLAEADPAIQDAFEWLQSRGLAQLREEGGQQSIFLSIGRH